MIRTFTFHAPVGTNSPDRTVTKVREVVKQLVRFQHVLRGMQVSVADAVVVLKLRVAGINQWNIHADARRLAALILRRCNVDWKAATLEHSVTEPNRKDLLLGEGRTPMSRRPRAERMADGRPWAHVAWWGDSLDDEPE